MPSEWQYLDFVDFLVIAEALVRIPAESLGRSERVISQAESAPQVTRAGFAGVEAYATFAEKAAILCARLIPDHPLPDGNKRTAFLCMVEFIERNGGRFERAAEDTPASVAGVLVDLAAHRISEHDFVEWVSRRTIV